MTDNPRTYPPWLSYLVATLMSISMLAMQATLPFKLKTLGGGLDSVGFLFMWTSFWYVMAGLFLSWISHHAGPRRVMLMTLVCCGVSVLLIPGTTAIWQVYALSTVYLMSVCLFWAAMEHASTGLHSRLTLVQSTMAFCVAYSSGNSLGQMASSLLQAQSLTIPFVISAGVLVVVLGLTWVTISPQAGFQRSTPTDILAFPAEARERLQRSLRIARPGLVGTYGMYALICLFLPRYLWEQRQFSRAFAGSFVGLMLLVMAVTYALHYRHSRWPHRLWAPRLAPFGAAVCVIVAGLASEPIWIGLAVVGLGVAAATSYAHHLYYSLEEPGKRARNAGIHEALIGVAFMAPPALAGLAARFTAAPESIFWVGAAFGTTIGLLQNLVVLRKTTAA